MSFAAGGWSDSDGPSSASTGHFSIDAPRAAVSGPLVPDGRMSVTTINVFRFGGSLYIDIVFTPSPGADLDYASILDDDEEFELRIGGAEIAHDGSPVPIEIVEDTVTPGLMTAAEFEVTATDEAGIQRALSDAGIKQFRYLLAITDHVPGLVEIEFLLNSWMDTRGDGPATQSIIHARIDGPTASLADPLAGQSIDANRFNGRGFIDVTIPTPGGVTIDRATVTDSDAEFVLTGPGRGSVALDDSQDAVFLRTDTGGDVFRYYLTGEFALGLAVTLELLYGSWETSDGNPSQAPQVSQTQTATRARASST